MPTRVNRNHEFICKNMHTVNGVLVQIPCYYLRLLPLLTACEGGIDITAMNGSFTSNNYPLDYGNNDDCSWTFFPPSANHVSTYKIAGHH